LLRIGGRALFDDRRVPAHAVEVRVPARISRGPRRGWTPLSDVLPDGDVAGTCALLHDGARRFEDRKRSRHRRDHRVGALCGRCRRAADFSPAKAGHYVLTRPTRPTCLARPTRPTCLARRPARPARPARPTWLAAAL